MIFFFFPDYYNNTVVCGCSYPMYSQAIASGSLANIGQGD